MDDPRIRLEDDGTHTLVLPGANAKVCSGNTVEVRLDSQELVDLHDQLCIWMGQVMRALGSPDVLEGLEQIRDGKTVPARTLDEENED